jgi:DNA-binding GntR family transcriptional regulator
MMEKRMEVKTRFARGATEHAAQFVADAIRDGRWRAGEQIDVTALAAELKISASPVREALSRLRGERILETRHRGGFSTPLLQAHQLGAEYELLGILAPFVSRRSTAAEGTGIQSERSYSQRFADLLAAISQAAGMPPAGILLQKLELRIASYVNAEPSMVANAEIRLHLMEIALTRGDGRELSDLLEAHFRTCVDAAPALAKYVFERSKRFEI